MPEFEASPNPRGLPRMAGPAADSAYSTMIDHLRTLLDRFAGAALDEGQVARLDAGILDLTDRLEALQVEEARQQFARVQGAPGHGQTMCPAFTIEEQTDTSIRGHITFGRYFLGANNAAHGGAVACAFDEILGIPANAINDKMARTAYLHVDYRSITPIGIPLPFKGWVEKIEGRKRFVRGELRHGDILCAEGEGLFVELLPGQP